MASSTTRKMYRKIGKRSLCSRVKKDVAKCKKIRHCTIANRSGKKYCRKNRSTRYSKRSAYFLR